MAKPHPAHLAARVCDAIDYLADHHKAYEAVERLLSTQSGDPKEDLSQVERISLQWLLLTLNAAMRDRIDEARAAAETARSDIAGVSHAR